MAINTTVRPLELRAGRYVEGPLLQGTDLLICSPLPDLSVQAASLFR